MEAMLEEGDFQGMECHAGALKAYTETEPLPWTGYYIARGRALASHGRGDRSEETRDELERLRDEAERVGLNIFSPDVVGNLLLAYHAGHHTAGVDADTKVPFNAVIGLQSLPDVSI